jgi:hypothetical protein
MANNNNNNNRRDNNINTKQLDEMLADKNNMTLEQLNEKYDLNIKFNQTKDFPTSENDLRFYTLESFHNSILNEYKFNLQNNPDLKSNIFAVYSKISKEYPLP